MAKKEKVPGKVKIIPLGGLEQIGMNITVFEDDDSIIIVDCGLSFPDDEMLGVDIVIPNINYLKKNKDKIKGMVITHGHEDHIGAIPYVLKEINIPLYATKLTMGLIDSKLEEHGLLGKVKRKVISYGQTINLGTFKVEFIRTNHSIADAAAFAIYTRQGIIIHTGDFKVDYTPVYGEPIDLQRLGELGKKGVLALLMDSTNAIKPGFTMSESTIGKVFDNIFNENRKSRIIIATFASNVDRVQQIINMAAKYGRKLAVDGRSMVKTVEVAMKLGYLSVPDNTLIDIEEMKNYSDEQMVLITTGSQGESSAALARMAASLHRKVVINPGDVVVFSSTPIPGNEKSVSNVINELAMKGAKVIFQDTHVSGHACQEELKLIYTLVKPKYAIPVHGEFRHLIAHKELAVSMGIPKDNVYIINSGDVVEFDEGEAKLSGSVEAGAVYVDGLGVGDVGNVVLRDRQQLSEGGMMVIIMVFDEVTKELVAMPEIISRGFIYTKEAGMIIDECTNITMECIEKFDNDSRREKNRIKNLVKENIGQYLWKNLKRSPLIIPVIIEAGV